MLNNFPTRTTQFSAVVGLCILSIICSTLLHDYVDTFNFQHKAILNGEWYRVLTHGFWHTNAAHLMLNIGGALILWALHGEYYTTRHVAAIIGLGIIFSGLCVLWFSPAIDYYVGLSAALHGLFMWGVAYDISKGRYTGWLLFIGFGLKLVQEQVTTDETTEQLISATIATDAHIYGAIFGGIYFAGQFIWTKAKRRSPITNKD